MVYAPSILWSGGLVIHTRVGVYRVWACISLVELVKTVSHDIG